MPEKAAFGFNTPFVEQLDFFKRKLNLPSERWDDITRAAHDRAFIVAGAMKADLLDDLNKAVTKAIEHGKGLEEFRKDFAAIVQKHGWTGWTGEGSAGGEAWRTKVIYQTNLATSYAAGRYRQLTDPEFLKLRPYWRYVHNDSVLHPRPHHQAWGNMRLTLRYDHPFWKTHFPPNGWGCMCRVTPVEAPLDGDATEPPDGWDVRDSKGNIPGIDKGFDYAPGASVADEMRALVQAKVDKLPKQIGKGLAVDLNSTGGHLESPKLRLALREAERAMEGFVEVAKVFTPGGELVFTRQGSFDRIFFSDRELSQLAGNVITHSHPGIGSFSPEDIKLASAFEVSEIRAVDERFAYSMRPVGFSWDWHWWSRAASPYLLEARSTVTSVMKQEIADGTLTKDEFKSDYWHRVWQELANKFPLRYRRKPRSSDGSL